VIPPKSRPVAQSEFEAGFDACFGPLGCVPRGRDWLAGYEFAEWLRSTLGEKRARAFCAEDRARGDSHSFDFVAGMSATAVSHACARRARRGRRAYA